MRNGPPAARCEACLTMMIPDAMDHPPRVNKAAHDVAVQKRNTAPPLFSADCRIITVANRPIVLHQAMVPALVDEKNPDSERNRNA